jgi:exopolyphosphatase/guanosine-5'-triphosphate,3'-diphosphate pyrophosphatase
MRETTVAAFMKRYQVDRAQAARVEATALDLYNQIAEQAGDGRQHDQQLLQWASRLHEAGISIAYSGYHKHSAYILQNADMPGFSRMDQSQLAHIVLSHRGSLAKSRAAAARPVDTPLALAFRLAALLNRGRGGTELPPMRLARKNGGFELAIDKAWLKNRPLTETALEAESGQWQALGTEFRLKRLG